MQIPESTFLIWLDSLEGMAKSKLSSALEKLGRPSVIFELIKNKAEKAKEAFSTANVNKWAPLADEAFLSSLLSNLENSAIKFLTVADENLTESEHALFETTGAKVLYYKGNRMLISSKSPSIAIVGSRSTDVYGRRVTELFASSLAQAGFIIVSGLAAGADSLAHKAALDANAFTVAVLGGGLNHIYPAMNEPLAREIIEKGGLILSEYSPQTQPISYLFPERNRIIAALSHGVLLTQAAEKSGALHTKNFAIEYGKDVFAVPGDIFREQSFGCLSVLKNGHAHMVLKPEDILNFYKIAKTANLNALKQISMDEKLVLEALGADEISLNELVEKTKLPTKTLSSLLTTLRISGLIEQNAGCYYRK